MRIADPPLTEIGREQAEHAAAWLHEANLNAVALYASPMRRALETARIVKAALELPLNVLPDLCEADGMHIERGLGHADILKEWPDAILDARIEESGWWTPTPDSEPEASLYARAARSLDALRSRHLAEGHTLIIVTHGTFGSALVSSALGSGPCGYSRFVFNNCGISRLKFEESRQEAEPDTSSAEPWPSQMQEKVRLRFHNAVGHMPSNLLT